VLVVEAALDSGSLITARLAGEQGRCVMAVPGSIASPVSRGCHRLIRDGVALVQNVTEVLAELNSASENLEIFQYVESAQEPSVSARRLDKAGEMLLDALGFEPASIEDLIARTGRSAQEVAVGLGKLELIGLVETLPAGRYGRLSPVTEAK
jgi:DNA processing protein